MDRSRAQDAPYKDAFHHFVAHRTMLKAYIQSIVRDLELAEDTLSDVAVEIARSWGTYDSARPFAPWARGVARRVALDTLGRLGSLPRLLDDQVLEWIGAEVDALGSESYLDRRMEALEKCMEALPESSRTLIRLRYSELRSHDEIVRIVRRSANALYAAFSRLHEALAECIQRRLEHA